MVACRSVEGEADASTASAQSVADYDVRLGEMGSELLEAKKRLTEMLPDPLTHVEPAPVEDRSVEVLPVEDKRPLYAAGLMGAGMLFMLMSLAATRTPLAHDVPRMEPVHAYSAEELEPFAEAASTETFSMSPTGKRRRMNPAMASHTL